MSKPTKARSRNQLSRAEIKAYEARRAAARKPEETSAIIPKSATSTRSANSAGKRVHIMSREEEYKTIKADMKRLVLILLVMLAVLVIATFILG